MSAKHFRIWYIAWTTLLDVEVVPSELKGTQKDKAALIYMCHESDRRVSSRDVVVLASVPSGAHEVSILYTDSVGDVGVGPG